MPREIKFRAWDKELKKFYEPTFRGYEWNIFEIMLWMQWHILAIDSSREGSTKQVYYLKEYYERFEIMQFTWLKDKNEIEIFEWDILKWIDSLIEVKFENWMFLGLSISDWVSIWNSLSSRLCLNTLEIVWNIYKNPELLK